MDVQFRRVGPGDGRLLRAVRLAALADSPDAFASSTDIESRWSDETWDARAIEWSTGQTSATFVAESELGTVGLVGTYRNDAEPGTVELVSMWVAPHGRGKGVGSRLIEMVLAWARDAGARRVALWVVQGNHHARARYERSGFSACDAPDVPDSSPCKSEIRMARSVVP